VPRYELSENRYRCQEGHAEEEKADTLSYHRYLNPTLASAMLPMP
jgi:hypothetical protein